MLKCFECSATFAEGSNADCPNLATTVEERYHPDSYYSGASGRWDKWGCCDNKDRDHPGCETEQVTKPGGKHVQCTKKTVMLECKMCSATFPGGSNAECPKGITVGEKYHSGIWNKYNTSYDPDWHCCNNYDEGDPGCKTRQVTKPGGKHTPTPESIQAAERATNKSAGLGYYTDAELEQKAAAATAAANKKAAEAAADELGGHDDAASVADVLDLDVANSGGRSHAQPASVNADADEGSTAIKMWTCLECSATFSKESNAGCSKSMGEEKYHPGSYSYYSSHFGTFWTCCKAGKGDAPGCETRQVAEPGGKHIAGPEETGPSSEGAVQIQMLKCKECSAWYAEGSNEECPKSVVEEKYHTGSWEYYNRYESGSQYGHWWECCNEDNSGCRTRQVINNPAGKHNATPESLQAAAVRAEAAAAELERKRNESSGFGAITDCEATKQRAKNNAAMFGEITDAEVPLIKAAQVAKNKASGFGAITDREVINQRAKNNTAMFGEITDAEVPPIKAAQVAKNKASGFGAITDREAINQRAKNNAAMFGKITDAEIPPIKAAQRAKNNAAMFGEITDAEVPPIKAAQEAANNASGFGAITDFDASIQRAKNNANGCGAITDREATTQRAKNESGGYGNITDAECLAERASNSKTMGLFGSYTNAEVAKFKLVPLERALSTWDFAKFNIESTAAHFNSKLLRLEKNKLALAKLHAQKSGGSTQNEFSPVASRAGGALLKQAWATLVESHSASKKSIPRETHTFLLAVTREYIASCIEAAKVDTELLKTTYSSTRDQHKGMYTSTMETVRLDPSYNMYTTVLEGLTTRVQVRAAAKKPAQRTSDLFDVYTDAAAVQERYVRFMRALSIKTGNGYTTAPNKSPYRASEKIGFAFGPSQWDASMVKDIVRGAQEMPDVAKGLMLFELLIASDPNEATGSLERGWNAMGAHKGYNTFRCALELLEATGHADDISEIEGMSVLTHAAAGDGAKELDVVVPTYVVAGATTGAPSNEELTVLQVQLKEALAVFARSHTDSNERMAKKDAQIERVLAEKDAQISRVQAESRTLLAEKDAQIERAMAEKDAQIERALAEKDAQIARVQTATKALLAEKDAQIERAMAEKDAQIARVHAENKVLITKELEASMGIQLEINALSEKEGNQMRVAIDAADGKVAELDAQIRQLSGDLRMLVTGFEQLQEKVRPKSKAELKAIQKAEKAAKKAAKVGAKVAYAGVDITPGSNAPDATPFEFFQAEFVGATGVGMAHSV
eukprot:gene16548-12276_t